MTYLIVGLAGLTVVFFALYVLTLKNARAARGGVKTLTRSNEVLASDLREEKRRTAEANTRWTNARAEQDRLERRWLRVPVAVRQDVEAKIKQEHDARLVREAQDRAREEAEGAAIRAAGPKPRPLKVTSRGDRAYSPSSTPSYADSSSFMTMFTAGSFSSDSSSGGCD